MEDTLMTGWDVMGAEATWLDDDEFGCEAHSRPECLCDVKALEGGVAITSVAMADRLIELGTPLDRFAFISWANELTASVSASRRLHAISE